MTVTMSDEVGRTLDALDLSDEHAAAAALARVYADQLDSADRTERAADAAISLAIRSGADADVTELLQTLRGKLAARATVANIGPRLAELLGRLLATPKDAAAGKPAAAPPKAAPSGALALLRGGKVG